ncbi:MAG: PP2C family protein-serine/threonine phosphatase [Saprospiraceae bacterium]|nr:PP2C family protein-serine/threonine phosphatase [Candidatus Opimibacter skivensis]MBL0006737.1 PP2C family protein-serine/threonine phosphatase [Candidatus Opimibacter skivensis]MBP8086526.1 PP2C family protein-serine/threonine phosphatase [Saprospiraceae bacterium]
MNYLANGFYEHYPMNDTGQLSIEKLQQELSLKQLQINSLLTITQAINDNVAAPELYSMYKSFIGWEMGIKRMALFFKQDDEWECATHLQADQLASRHDLGPILKRYTKTQRIIDTDPEPLQGFDLVIPVYHKKNPIAFALVGGVRADSDEYTRIQFITTFTNIIAVAIENKRLFKKQIEQERYARDMELASSVQKMLIPDHLPKSKFFEMATVYKPHFTVGGDYFDFIQYDERRLTFCIADISGKGVSAAILMANFQAILQSLIYQYRDLETFVFALNEAVYRITRSDRFITLFIGELNLRTNTLQYINAGHFPPFLIQNGTITRLESGCTIIGAFETLPEIQMGEVKLTHPGTLFACTDGLTDIVNDLEQYFDESHLLPILQGADKAISAEEINEALMLEVDRFRGSRPYPDDIAVLTCKYMV